MNDERMMSLPRNTETLTTVDVDLGMPWLTLMVFGVT